MNKGKICVSVCAETAVELIEQIKRAEELADLIEIRFDCLRKEEIEKSNFPYNENYIFTFRPKSQGGKREISLQERESFWNSGDDFCGADFEEDVIENHLGWLYKPVICSYHDFSKVPDNLDEIYERIKTAEVDIIKIAVQTDKIPDTIKVWKLLERAKSENKEIIPIAMGETGKWTRILGLAHGAFLTYAALDSGKETAPGQVSAEDLIEVYRAKELDEKTEVYGIIGNPVSPSVSPYMQNAAFQFHGLNAVYIPFEVANLDEFIEKFVREETREVELNLKGFSVTIPHKQAILKHLDFIDEDAEKIGAVNTLKIIDGKIYGYNTDTHGFIKPLKNAYGDLSKANVAVVGNGGAARACVYALKKENAEVTIIVRNIEKAEDLAKEFNVNLQKLSTQHSALSTFDILVNATPLGMKGKFENETPLTAKQLEGLNLVYDLVYNPFETELLKQADKANVPKISGLAMLVAQGMRQFEIWTGKNAPLKKMSAAALNKLK